MKTNINIEFSHNRQTLKVFLYYRVAFSGLLLAMFYAGIAPNVLGAGNAKLYLVGNQIYFVASLLSLFLFPVSSLARSQTRIHVLLILDTLTQLTLIHASGGMDSGLGYLLIITTAMTSIFIRGQLAYAYAAFMSMALIVDNIYLHQTHKEFIRIVFSSGTLGVLIFATTIALQYLSGKIRVSSLEAETQARYIQNLQKIAQNIVTRMQTGVIVVDHTLKIELMNTSAKQMLDLPTDTQVYGEYLANIRELAPVLKSWEDILQNKENSILRIRPGSEIRINIAHLETGDMPKNIFYLEDYASIKQHAQQLKLASLGRLAASIAHEIRNPLGALSHAAQLLAESEALNKADTRMTEIILSNSDRVNEIIENTLALSRRKEPEFEKINLSTWLPSYLDDAYMKSRDDIELTILGEKLLTRFDTTHLQQILSNLIDNGLRYSNRKHGHSWVQIKAGLQSGDEKPYIEVRDNGKGIPANLITEIFEPFYTTDEKGSGLGLYISKELSEMNHANLHYYRTSSNISCFRIDFSHHQRMR